MNTHPSHIYPQKTSAKLQKKTLPGCDKNQGPSARCSRKLLTAASGTPQEQATAHRSRNFCQTNIDWVCVQRHFCQHTLLNPNPHPPNETKMLLTPY